MTFSGCGWSVTPPTYYKRPRQDLVNNLSTVTWSVNFKMKTNVIFIRNSQMYMEKNYFITNEENGWSLLQKLNDKYNYFTELTHSPSASTWDVSGYTRDGRKVIIELKTRQMVLLPDGQLSGQGYTCDTIFIEHNKHSFLLMEHVVDGFVPLYINFLEDGTVIIHNLLHITHFKEDVKSKITSRGYTKYGGYERNAARLCLYLDDATIVHV